MGVVADAVRSIFDPQHTLTERWRPLADWPYWISSEGRVFSEHIPPGGSDAYGILTPYTNESDCYYVVDLRSDGERKQRLVHGMVARCYIGPRPSDAHEVYHIDGDTFNNAVSNLEWRLGQDNTVATETTEPDPAFEPKDEAPF